MPSPQEKVAPGLSGLGTSTKLRHERDPGAFLPLYSHPVHSTDRETEAQSGTVLMQTLWLIQPAPLPTPPSLSVSNAGTSYFQILLLSKLLLGFLLLEAKTW